MDDLKPMIRGVLLVSGQRVTEHEFCRAFYNTEGRSFQEIVRKNGKNFFDFMRSMPDTCKVMRIGDEVIVQKVSSEATVHIDMLKCSERTKRKKKPAKFKRLVRRHFWTNFCTAIWFCSTDSCQTLGILCRIILRTNRFDLVRPLPNQILSGTQNLTLIPVLGTSQSLR